MAIGPEALDDTTGLLGAELLAALAASNTGTWRWDAATGRVLWDTTLEELSGFRAGEFGGTYEAWLATLHPDEVAGVLAVVERAIEERSSYHFEHRAIWPDGTVRWLECRGEVTVDADGTFTGTVGCAVDVTDRKLLERAREVAIERERRVRDRIEFLAGLTESALTSTDHLSFMRTACAAAVPKLGDWCSIHFVPEPGAPIERVVAHVDPEKVAWADALAERFPYNPSGETGVPAVIRTGTVEFIPEVTDEFLQAALERSELDTDEARTILDALGVTSVITVPLRSSRGVLGAMQFVSAESASVYDADDLALAQVAASRIADALDIIWLAHRYRHISTTLQRALLPPALPTVPGIEIAVRYWPAGAAVEVGGDFYDVFASAPGQWSLLIGDVCGTGPDAAALTGISRHTVRAAARHEQDHQSVLEWLNEALRYSNRGRFCTALYGTLRPKADEWELATAAGGHPLPVLARADGSVEVLGRAGTLLGVYDDPRFHVATTDLHVGDTVVLYTDGVTDLPPPHDLDLDDVAAIVRTAAEAATAEEVADAMGTAVTDLLSLEERHDDIAVVVLRVVGAGPA